MHLSLLTKFVITFLLCSFVGANAEKIRITQKKSGKTITVESISIKDDLLICKLKGKSYEFPLNSLTDKSVERIKALLEKSPATTSSDLSYLNEAFGVTLFAKERSLWNENTSEIASRLSWPAESKNKSITSYRFYPPKDYTFLGAHPYCATLYGNENEQGDRLSLVFANKGDYGSTSGLGPDHFKKIHPDLKMPSSLNAAIELDAKLITESLTKALKQEPVEQYYGEKEDKRKILRWDADEHALLLTSVEGEFTSLLIVSKENADKEGKVNFIKDSLLKAKLLKNVTKADNGDINIANIPMVNQGPKGYCAPATFERAMSYMSIPADMYLLATAATQEGGGTNTYLLAESCKRIVRSKARKIRDINLEEDLDIKFVKKYIDKGVPILWQMRSLEEYNKIVNDRTAKRKSIKEFDTWTKQIQKESDDVSLAMKANQSNHHICMIIGYNEKTRELAVSDSWGPRYELRWVHIDIAKAVTTRGGFVIDF